MLGMKKKKKPTTSQLENNNKKSMPTNGGGKKKGKNKEIKTYITFCFDGMNSIQVLQKYAFFFSWWSLYLFFILTLLGNSSFLFRTLSNQARELMHKFESHVDASVISLSLNHFRGHFILKLCIKLCKSASVYIYGSNKEIPYIDHSITQPLPVL